MRFCEGGSPDLSLSGIRMYISLSLRVSRAWPKFLPFPLPLPLDISTPYPSASFDADSLSIKKTSKGPQFLLPLPRAVIRRRRRASSSTATTPRIASAAPPATPCQPTAGSQPQRARGRPHTRPHRRTGFSYSATPQAPCAAFTPALKLSLPLHLPLPLLGRPPLPSSIISSSPPRTDP